MEEDINNDSQVEVEDMKHSISQLIDMKLDANTAEKFENLLSSSLSYILAHFKKLQNDYDEIKKDLIEYESKRGIKDVLGSNDPYASIPLLLYNKKNMLIKCSVDLITQAMLAIKLLREARRKYKASFNWNKSIEVYNESLKQMSDMDNSRFEIFKKQASDQKDFILDIVKTRDDMIKEIVHGLTSHIEKNNRIVDSLLHKESKNMEIEYEEKNNEKDFLKQKNNSIPSMEKIDIEEEPKVKQDINSEMRTLEEQYKNLPPLKEDKKDKGKK